MRLCSWLGLELSVRVSVRVCVLVWACVRDRVRVRVRVRLRLRLRLRVLGSRYAPCAPRPPWDIRRPLAGYPPISRRAAAVESGLKLQ